MADRGLLHTHSSLVDAARSDLGADWAALVDDDGRVLMARLPRVRRPRRAGPPRGGLPASTSPWSRRAAAAPSPWGGPRRSGRTSGAGSARS